MTVRRVCDKESNSLFNILTDCVKRAEARALAFLLEKALGFQAITAILCCFGLDLFLSDLYERVVER